jgi:hypothetical protein
MKIFDNFFDHLEHHPIVMILTVLAAGVIASIVVSTILLLSRPIY